MGWAAGPPCGRALWAAVLVGAAVTVVATMAAAAAAAGAADGCDGCCRCCGGTTAAKGEGVDLGETSGWSADACAATGTCGAEPLVENMSTTTEWQHTLPGRRGPVRSCRARAALGGCSPAPRAAPPRPSRRPSPNSQVFLCPDH